MLVVTTFATAREHVFTYYQCLPGPPMYRSRRGRYATIRTPAIIAAARYNVINKTNYVYLS